jgi:hypothetical protein
MNIELKIELEDSGRNWNRKKRKENEIEDREGGCGKKMELKEEEGKWEEDGVMK